MAPRITPTKPKITDVPVQRSSQREVIYFHGREQLAWILVIILLSIMIAQYTHTIIGCFVFAFGFAGIMTYERANHLNWCRSKGIVSVFEDWAGPK